MNCIIIEDQAPAQRVLKKFIEDRGSLTLQATFSDALKALDLLKTQPVDLIFLDIHLPKISGIDFLKTLSNPPAVILTTAFTDYAVESYELNVVDYLVKPFSFERFVKAVSKVQPAAPPRQTENTAVTNEEFYLKSGHEHIKINSRDVLFIHSDMDYTELHLADKKHLSPETLARWEEKLSTAGFARVHKSYLINTSKIEKIAGNQIYLFDGNEVPMGRAFKDGFLERFVR